MVALLFWNVVKVDQLTQPMLKELSQATTAARGDDWPAAEVLTQQIQVHWEKGMHHLRFVQMHDAIDGTYPPSSSHSTLMKKMHRTTIINGFTALAPPLSKHRVPI